MCIRSHSKPYLLDVSKLHLLTFQNKFAEVVCSVEGSSAFTQTIFLSLPMLPLLLLPLLINGFAHVLA